MDYLENNYPESRFGGYSDRDGTVAFYCRVNALLRADMLVLDIGCGRGAALIDDQVDFRRNLRRLNKKVERVIGIDVDPMAATNSGLTEFRLLTDNVWPIEDSSIDLIVSDFVLEHIEDPLSYFKEVWRVLKPGGIFCARTANKIGYVALAARLVPNRKHADVLGFVQKDRREYDIFSTYYKINTIRTIRSLIAQHGLEGIVYGYEAEPSYLGFSQILYKIGKIVHALTPGPLRTGIFVFARKP